MHLSSTQSRRNSPVKNVVCSVILDVYQVQNKKTGAPVHIEQQTEAPVTVFDQVQGPISILFENDYDLSFFGLDYNSFMNSGVYDKEYLDSRRQALFVGEAERVKQRGLTMTFYPSPGQWRAASDGDLNILGSFFFGMLTFYLIFTFPGQIPYDDLMMTIMG